MELAFVKGLSISHLSFQKFCNKPVKTPLDYVRLNVKKYLQL